MSKRSDIFKYVSDKFGVMPDYPWKKFPDYAVLRQPKNGKWFALIMNVPGNKIGLLSDDEVEVLDVKCHPEAVGSLRQSTGVFAAYHMNKEHWVSVLLDGSVSEAELQKFIDDSYELIKK